MRLRRLNGEIVWDESGNPIGGSWERIVEPIGAPIQTGNREPRTLLTGVLRCGKPKPDGSICGVLSMDEHLLPE